MKIFTEYFNNKSLRTIKKIIENEDLDVVMKIEESTLGDTLIRVYGTREVINILKDVYNMVK